MYQHLIYEQQGEIDVVILNRPDTANAFTQEMLDEVAAVFTQIERDSPARAVILKAAGKLFSGGGDIKMFRDLLAAKAPLPVELVLGTGRMALAVRRCKKPVVAVVQGAAAGAGFGLAMACDYRILSESAKLVPAFNGIGLSGDTGLMYFLGKNLGPARTYELMTLKTALSAREAKDLGLATEVVPDDALEAQGQAFTEKLLHKPTRILERQKALLNAYFYSELETFNQEEAVAMHLSSKEEDFAEAVSAFLDKRPAKFSGR